MEQGCLCCAGKNELHKTYAVRLESLQYDDERRLKKLLEQNYGICEVKIDLFQGVCEIHYNPEKISLAEVRTALQSQNYLLEATVKRWSGRLLEKHGETIRLTVSCLLVVSSWVLHFMQPEVFTFPNTSYVVLNAVAILIAGYSTLSTGLTSLWHRKLNVSVLITLAALSAILIGDLMEAASVLLISIVGEALERASLKGASSRIFSMLVLGARFAMVKENGTLVEIPVHKVRKGQTVVVRQGMKIPVDGIITVGNAQVNEAPITGESALKGRTTGDKVYTGTIVEYGTIELEAITVGGDTALAQIAKLVDKARHEKTESEKTVDKFARYMIPIILILAGLAFVGNLLFGVDLRMALERALTILIVACPCALVLATPTAVNAALGRAARSGILFKNGGLMEQLTRVKTLLLDKTGTLTYARPHVVAVRPFGACTEQQVIEAAAFVEQRSNHPLAKAICTYAQGRQIPLEEPEKFLEFEGGGACAITGDKHIKVGALWLMEDGREVPAEVAAWRDESGAQGYTSVYVADRTAFLGGINIEDEVRGDAVTTLRDIKAEGVDRLIMITGDNAQIAGRVAKDLGIDEVVAECMPDTKYKKIQEEKAKGNGVRLVAMVGDGINDAPALAASDVGIAMGAVGSDVAVEASDISLMHDNLSGLLYAMRISRMALATIKLNIFFAIAVNIAAVGFASVGTINMLFGALLHQASALVVIFNSMLLFLRNPAGARRRA